MALLTEGGILVVC